MKSKIIGLTAVAALAVLISAGAVSAYQGDYTQKGPNYTEERHEAMTKAFENNDYEAWSELMNGRGRVTQVVNKDNFAQFAEAHRLAEEGKYDEADAIREQLGLRTRTSGPRGEGYGQGSGKGQGQGQRQGNGTCDGSCQVN